MDHASKTILEIIAKRRSLPPHAMNGKPISPACLRLLLDAAQRAPCHHLSEPWFFQVFTLEARERFARAARDALHEVTKGEAAPAKLQATADNVLRAGAVISIELRPEQPPRNPEFEELLAIGCAVQNLHLAACAHGLGGLWTTPKWAEATSYYRFLGLSPGHRSLGVFYLGYASTAAKNVLREPSDRTSWHES
jgi:nitroreductase